MFYFLNRNIYISISEFVYKKFSLHLLQVPFFCFTFVNWNKNGLFAPYLLFIGYERTNSPDYGVDAHDPASVRSVHWDVPCLTQQHLQRSKPSNWKFPTSIPTGWCLAMVPCLWMTTSLLQALKSPLQVALVDSSMGFLPSPIYSHQPLLPLRERSDRYLRTMV